MKKETAKKYIVSYDNNNKFYSNNLHYKKMMSDLGCESISVFNAETKELILKAEKYVDGKIYLSVDNR